MKHFLVTPQQQLEALSRMLLWVPSKHNGRIIQLINRIQAEIDDRKRNSENEE